MVLDNPYLPLQIDAPIFSIFSCPDGELYGAHHPGFLAMWLLGLVHEKHWQALLLLFVRPKCQYLRLLLKHRPK